jgi:hypothetical protein
MFRKFKIWRKIKTGLLNSDIIDSRPSTTWQNATSEIIKHIGVDGKHIATTHRIRYPSGMVIHWDAKDFRLKDVRYWRS